MDNGRRDNGRMDDGELAVGEVLVTASEGREADERATALGVPERTLMENAGWAVAQDIERTWPDAWSIVVLCGTGNNGGDGYVAARKLAEAGRRVTILALDPSRSRTEPAEEARQRVPGSVEIRALNDDNLQTVLPDADLLVDALLGRGLSRPLSGSLASLVEHLNTQTIPTLAVDVPTGIDADAAVPPGPYLQADRTVQLAWACPASALSPARFAFGSSVVVKIGIPEGALDARPRPRVMNEEAFRAFWSFAHPERHKYQAGTVAIAAGSASWAGAAELACRGAHRGGAGLVTLYTDAPHPNRWPETIVREVASEPGALAAAWRDLQARHAQACVIGPGLDPSREPELADLLAHTDAPMVLDATALTPSLQPHVQAHGGCWVTPHLGEAGRLLGRPTSALHSDPMKAAQELADTWNAGVVLKNAGGIIATPSGPTWLVAGGHPGMASGGTGDVLAGLLGAALASLAAEKPQGARQPSEAVSRVAAAVYLHARAGERVGRELGSGMTASDVAEALAATCRDLGGAW